MRLHFRRLSLLCFIGCLFLAAGVSGEEEKERPVYGHGELPRVISVVKTDVPPRIDGIHDEGEWAAAAEITGLIHVASFGQFGVRRPMINMAGTQSRFWITYDDNYLYVAHHSPPPDSIKDSPASIEAMLRRTELTRDAVICWDDAISISIIHPDYPEGDYYNICINALRTTFECVFGLRMNVMDELKAAGSPVKHNFEGINLDWDPEVINASRLSLDGWFVEAAVSWKDLGPYIQKPAPGGMLYMNFARVWQEVMQESHVWKMNDHPYPGWGSDKYGPAGKVIFRGDEGIVVQLKDTGNLPRGEAAFLASVINMSSSPASVYVIVDTDAGEFAEREEMNLGPGEKREYRFSGRITDRDTSTVSFIVEDAGGGIIHNTTLPVIMPASPELYLRKYRSRDMLRLETDLTYIGAADLRRTSITVDAVNRETGRRVFRQTFRGFSSYRPALEFSTRGWDIAEYDINLTFNAPGIPRYHTTIPYEYPPLPVWWENRYGYEDIDRDRVPYPWTDMKVEGERVSVWGRIYDFKENILPSEITTLGYRLLRSPARIVAETSRGDVLDSSAVKCLSDWTMQKNTRVEGVRSAKSGSLEVTNRFWSEYDGLLWNRIEVKAPPGTTIDSLYLEMPVTALFTDVINPSDYSIRQTGLLSQEGYTGDINRQVWLGNGDGGLQWIMGYGGIHVKEPMKAVRVAVEPEGATLRVNMIDIPAEWDGPFTMEFGIIATPSRPKTWRTPEHRAYRGMGGEGGGASWYPHGLEVLPAADPGRKAGDYLYVWTHDVSVDKDASCTEDFKHYGHEWLKNPDGRTRPAWNTEVASVTLASRSFRDYFAWRYWRYQQKYGYYGLYYDSPASDVLGTRDVMKRLYNITLSNEDFAARDQGIGLHQSGMPNMAYLGFGNHNWNAENLNSRITETQQTYIGLIDAAVFRAEYMGHNFGWPLRFLGQRRIRREWVDNAGGPDVVADHLTGLMMLHDSYIVHHEPCCLLPPVYDIVTRRLEDAIAKHNFYHWAYRFIPYWRQDIVDMPREGLLASFYLSEPHNLPSQAAANLWAPELSLVDSYFDGNLPPNIRQNNRRTFIRAAGTNTIESLPPHKAIMIVYNDTGWEGEMRLSPDWDKLGLGAPGTLKVENAVHTTGFRVEETVDGEGNITEKGVFFEVPEEYARIEGDEIVFPMTGHNYRMIVIEQANP